MNKNKKFNFLLDLLAFAAGAQTVLAFAPFNHAELAILGLLILLASWINASAKRAFWRGWLFGLGLFGFGCYWVYISIHLHGGASIIVATFVTAIFIAFLALFPAIVGLLLTKLFPKNSFLKYVIVFPTIWTSVEILRSFIFTGFPWLSIGYSQINQPLSAIAPILSVYAVSFLTAMTSGIVLVPFVSNSAKKTTATLLLLIFIWLCCGYLNNINWTQKEGKQRITLIQGNIAQKQKWDPYYLENILATYKNITAQHWKSNTIVWPEAAVPLFQWQAKPFLQEMSKLAKQHNTNIITGIPIQNTQTRKYYNGMLALGKTHAEYLKRHLVPFGEYPFLSPITNWFAKTFHIPMSSFSAGKKNQPPFKIDNIIIAPSICYEIAYPLETITNIPSAQLLINISDDSWFGNSIAAAQQLQIAQMRARETGRYLLAATNNGITAIIKPNGRILRQAQQFKKTSLTATIYLYSGSTPWVLLAKKLFDAIKPIA
ncbi:MAG: apolipoprotein N-acyltransferase [Gammaproteobacteria bacterium]|nr:apolipoprotein N-acyltransferase [Gammaproteobacteria bacterium]